MKFAATLALSFAALGALSTAASAASVTALESAALGVSYTVAPSSNVASNPVYADPQTGNALVRSGNTYQDGSWDYGRAAGQFWLKDQRDDSFVAFCMEYAVEGVMGQTYTSVSLDTGLTATQSSDIRKLWGGAYGSIAAAAVIDRSLYATAFQLALWEIVEEAPGASYNLHHTNGGEFRVGEGGDFSGAKAVAQNWLDDLAGWAETDAQLVRLAGSGQDLVAFAEPSPVPLPAGLGLLVAGLGALGVASRRKAG